jgi:hypothetical protein
MIVTINRKNPLNLRHLIFRFHEHGSAASMLLYLKIRSLHIKIPLFPFILKKMN